MISKSVIYKERMQNIFKRTFSFIIRSKKKEFQNKDRISSFNTIYKQKRWGDENLSGGGSSIEFTKNTREVIFKIINDFNCNSMLDIACGDLKWMPLLLKRLESNFIYIGADIVQNLIQQHKLAYPQYKFYHLDFVKDRLTTCDLILCRDALQHLTIADIRKALENFSHSGAKYLLATTHIRYPRWKNKRDIRVGQCRDRNLLLEPFGLEDPIVIYSDSKISHKFLGLWELPLKYNH